MARRAKKLDHPVLARAEVFLASNARVLERRRFAHLFRDAAPEPAIVALCAYQNEDGGFGQALEPDKRCPDSQPIDALFALEVLEETGLYAPVVKKLCAWLDSVTTREGGVPFALPAVRDWPRAPWWDVEGDKPPASLNPTAAIVAYLKKHRVKHPWVKRAEAYCWKAIEKSQLEEAHEVVAIVRFLEVATEAKVRKAAEAAFARVQAKIDQLVPLEPDAPGYFVPPLVWAPAPDSVGRRLFDDGVLAQHLEAMIERQEKDGGWPISWPPVTPACGLEWRGAITLGALKTLRAYGVL
jgi:hypothetical protein